jgi:hypothetical protein
VFAARVPNVTVLKTSDIDAKCGSRLFKGRVTVQSVLDSDSRDLTTDSAFSHIAISIRGKTTS